MTARWTPHLSDYIFHASGTDATIGFRGIYLIADSTSENLPEEQTEPTMYDGLRTDRPTNNLNTTFSTILFSRYPHRGSEVYLTQYCALLISDAALLVPARHIENRIVLPLRSIRSHMIF